MYQTQHTGILGICGLLARYEVTLQLGIFQSPTKCVTASGKNIGMLLAVHSKILEYKEEFKEKSNDQLTSRNKNAYMEY